MPKPKKLQYRTDTVMFAQQWKVFLTKQSDNYGENDLAIYLKSPTAEADFVEHMQGVFDPLNKDYCAAHTSSKESIMNKAHYTNKQLKDNKFKPLYVPGFGKPRGPKSLEDRFAEALFERDLETK